MTIFRREACFFDPLAGFWCTLHRGKLLMLLRACMNLYFHIISGMPLTPESPEGNIHSAGPKSLGTTKENTGENLSSIIKYSTSQPIQ